MTEDDETATPEGADERTTAPQSPYGRRELAIGVAVLAAGLVVAFAVPLVLS